MFHYRLFFFVNAAIPLMLTAAAAGFHVHINAPHIHIDPPHIGVPHITVGPVAITPIGPVPQAAIKPAEKVINAATGVAANAASGVANVAVKSAENMVAPQAQVIGVIAGKESLSQAAKNIISSEGKQVAAVGQAVSQTNAGVSNLKVVAAESIGGNVGKTIMTIVDGPNRLQTEFAATAAIEAGDILQGKEPVANLIAEPLAAAIRAAELQFEPDSKPLPDNVKAKLASFYPADVIASARWAVGSISLSVPDVTNQARKIFSNVENAVTVGHVTVFVRDPADNYHWWAHELQHQVQYRDWGIDSFALKYVTSCHDVESNAEDKAQQVIPTGRVGLGC
jgi:hypothetical protein